MAYDMRERGRGPTHRWRYPDENDSIKCGLVVDTTNMRPAKVDPPAARPPHDGPHDCRSVVMGNATTA